MRTSRASAWSSGNPTPNATAATDGRHLRRLRVTIRLLGRLATRGPGHQRPGPAALRTGAVNGHQDKERHQAEDERDGDDGARQRGGNGASQAGVCDAGPSSASAAPASRVSLVKISNIDLSRGSPPSRAFSI